MRAVLSLLTLIALGAVLLVGYLVMQKQGTSPLIVHNFQRVIPSTSDPDGDRVSQLPMPPIPAPTAVPATPQPNPTSVQSTQPNTTQPYGAAKVDTIDASAPAGTPNSKATNSTPKSDSTANSSPKSDSTANSSLKSDSAANSPSGSEVATHSAVGSTAHSTSAREATAEPTTTTATMPKHSAVAPTKSDAASAPVKKPDTSSTFDSQGLFTLQKDMHKNGYHDKDPVVVVVDKGSHFTYVLQNQSGKVVIVYRASNAVGSADTPSPPGPYKVAGIQKYPVWTPPKSIDKDQKPVKPFNEDPHNPLGVEIIRLNKFGVALHGTDKPNSIRKDASHGCVRHANEEIVKIASMVRRGTTVIITDQFVGTKLSKEMFGSR